MEAFRVWAHIKGYKVKEAPNLFACYRQWAGTEQQRLEQLQWAYETPEVTALWCARGGYGLTRLIADLPDSLLVAYPKWLVGFSDCTLLLNKLYEAGMASVHGPMALQATDKVPLSFFDQTLALLEGRTQPLSFAPHLFNTYGAAEGFIAGGNLSLLAHSVGTALLPRPEHTVLFLEEVDEYLYHVDRMLWQLRHHGYLESVAGILVGQFSGMKDHTVPFGGDAYEVVRAHIASLRCPIAFGIPTGHEAQHVPLMFGAPVLLTVDKKGCYIRFGVGKDSSIEQ